MAVEALFERLAGEAVTRQNQRVAVLLGTKDGAVFTGDGSQS
ncbi:hypothetical protein [Mesorhizobium sp.]|nr:hypothetical protein [Mesorhizobium sp.]